MPLGPSAACPATSQRHTPRQWWLGSSFPHQRNGADRMKLTLDQQLKLINEKTCSLWPDCSCPKTIAHWEDELDIEKAKVFEIDILESCEVNCFFAFACLASHCPNAKMKAYAQKQYQKLIARRRRMAALGRNPVGVPLSEVHIDA
jgi:hypothetical protein